MENNKRILSLVEPIPTSVSHQAMLFSILGTDQRYTNWLLNNYIQIFCLKDLGMQSKRRRGTLDFFFNEYGDWSLFELSSNPCIEFEKISYSFYKNNIKFLDVIQIIKTAINEGKYLYLGVDQYYISAYKKYMLLHEGHILFIYGYDETEKVVYTADNYGNGKYDYKEVPFDIIKIAFESVVKNKELQKEAYIGGIAILSLRMLEWHDSYNELEYINWKLIKYSLKEYLLEEALEKYEAFPHFAFGIDCYNELQKYIVVSQKNGEKMIDVRAFCSMLDHKRIMLFRMKKISDYLKLDIASILTQYDMIRLKFEIIINSILLWNRKKDKKRLNEIEKSLMETKEKEKRILKAFIDLIDQKE